MTAATPGQAAYERYKAAMDLAGVGADDWEDLADYDQAAWEAVPLPEPQPAPELAAAMAERDRFWNALFYIACRDPQYVPLAGPECVQVAKDAIDGAGPPAVQQ